MKKKTELLDVQGMHSFKRPLSYYTMGLSGKPEAREQKAFIACLMAEFPEEIGHNETFDIYSSLIVATSDFYDAGKFKGNKMNRYKKMGYQPGTLDIFIAYPVEKYHGFFCEMKSLTGRPTDEQKATLARHQERGYFATSARGFAVALSWWICYLQKKT